MRCRITHIFMIIGAIAVLSMTGSIDNAYAIDKMDYKIIFTTSWKNCSDRNLTSMDFYNSIVRQYLNMYNIHPVMHKPICINAGELEDTIAETDNDVLIIVIPDLLNSVKYIKDRSAFGHYTISDGLEEDEYLTIVSTALSIFPESKNSAWTLSHELSHFALDYKYNKIHPSYSIAPDTGRMIVIDWVHSMQEKKSVCENRDPSMESCSHLWTTVKSSSGNVYPVMNVHPSLSNLEKLQQPSSSKETKKPATVEKKEQQTFGLKFATKMSLKINDSYNNADLDYGDRFCISLDTDVLGRIDGDMALHKKHVKAMYVFPQVTGDDRNKYVFRQLDDSGNYVLCDTWKNRDDTKIWIMYQFLGDDQFRASQSNLVRIN